MEIRKLDGATCLIGGPVLEKVLDLVGADACCVLGHLLFKKRAWRDKHTRLHELAHHKQGQDPLFGVKYFVESILNGYEGNAYEREADAWADQVLRSRAARRRSRCSSSRRRRARR